MKRMLRENEQLGSLYVDNDEALKSALCNINLSARIAIDTEADSLHHYYEKVCLLQINTGDHIIIVDPLCGLDLSSLMDTLKSRLLVLHGADFDLRILRRDFSFSPSKIFDTTIAAQLLGYEKFGLADLVNTLFGVSLSKSARKLDWSFRPLNSKMLDYAANDVRYLISLSEALEKDLRALNRITWLQESCESLISSTMTDAQRNEEKIWRIKGYADLGLRGSAIVKELWRWRDEEARNADLPSFKILTNESLIEIAAWAIEHKSAEVTNHPRIPRTCRGTRLARLKKALAYALSLRPREWPRQLKKRCRGKSPDKELVERLKKRRDIIAEELRIAPQMLATQKTLSLIALCSPEKISEFHQIEGMLKWQVKILGESLLDEISRFNPPRY